MTKELNVQMVVERYDNGITMTWKDENSVFADARNVILKGNEASGIGFHIWEDIQKILEDELCDRVVMKINYKARD
jgi:hypothetical protein